MSATILSAKSMAINETAKVLSSESLYSNGEQVLYTNKHIQGDSRGCEVP